MDKELDYLRKMKAEKIRRFHMGRQASVKSALAHAPSYSTIQVDGRPNSMETLGGGLTDNLNKSIEYDEPSLLSQ